jgi:von Willebrand factor type A domain/Aerotolerance regulator N-terminal
MTFLLPLGLLALLTIPIIIVLHLLRERRRRVAVPSLLHWQNLPHRPEGERIRRLPLTLLLLLHLVVAGLLGLALGQPQLAGALSGGSRQIAIVIDTTTSMAARNGASTRFAQAQERARSALRGLGAGDSATLVAAGPTARVIAGGGKADLAGLLAALGSLKPGGAGADLPGALSLAEAAFDGPRSRQIMVLTDGGPQAGSAPLPSRLAAALDWQQIGNDQPNHAIVAFAARTWGANVQVYARAGNYGPATFFSVVRLYGDDQLLGTRDITIAANGETELTWTLPARYTRLRAALDGGDALPQDDDARLNLAQTRAIKALLVAAKPDALQRALAAVPGVSVTVLDPANYNPTAADTNAPELTIFDSFLPQAWPTGAVLAIHPPPGSALLEVRTQSRATRSAELSANGALLAGLSLGGVNFGRVQRLTPPAWATTLLADGNTPLILRGRSEAHEIAVWTFDLANSNLPTRLAFPLLVARTVRDLTPLPLPSSLQAGAPLSLHPDARADELRISGPDGMQTTLAAAPEITLDTLTQPGLYQLEERRAGTLLFRGQVPVNAGAPIEADLRPGPQPQIAGSASVQDAEGERQMHDLWPWLALGALAILMLEWGYLHR